MEYLPGESMQKRIDARIYKSGTTSQQEGLVQTDICDAITGMQAIHRKGLAHNDAQAKNFVVGPQQGKSAWVDYDMTREVTPNGSEQKRDVTMLVQIAMNMVEDRAGEGLQQLHRSGTTDLQQVYDTLCSC
jgi:tRNA A-37 threonylcarbamoyl transferase component Bud32